MNIFVSNLSHYANESDLKKMFTGFGKVCSTTIIKDKFSRIAMRFGLVEMINDAEAQSAIDGLNGKNYQGRKLNVHKASIRNNNRRKAKRSGDRRCAELVEID